jgi:hypothetical protein
MKCRSCGAEIPGDTTICDYCRSAAEAPNLVATAPQNTRAETFARIKASRLYEQRRSRGRLQALAGRGMTEQIGGVIALAAFAIMAIVVGAIFASSPIGWAAVIPIGAAVVSIGLLVAAVRSLATFVNSPIVGYAAIVAAKRISVSGGGQNSSTSMSYHATFEFEDGGREEYRVRQSLYSQLSERDSGVLFVRDTSALDFDRVLE